MIIKQLDVGGFDNNFSYVMYDENTSEAAIIDPCGDSKIIENIFIKNSNLIPKYILITHGHFDHISALKHIKSHFNIPVYAHPNCTYEHEKDLSDNEILTLGNEKIEVLFTPGHTDDSITYHLLNEQAIFTGDTLFVDWIGFCNAEIMFNSLQNKIYPLPDSNIVYSGHNYGKTKTSPLGREKKDNPYLAARTLTDFQDALTHLE